MPIYKYKDKKGYWARVNYTVNEKNLQKSKYGFKTKREAQEWEVETKKIINNDNSVTFKTFYDEYIETKKITIKKTTIERKQYMYINHIHPYFGNIPINKITSVDIQKWQKWIIEKKFTPSYTRSLHRELKAIFKFGEDHKNLINPMKKVDLIGSSKRTRPQIVWNVETFKKFISVVDDPIYKCLFFTFFYTGIRIGEAQALLWDDIDLNLKKININKTYIQMNGKQYITDPKTKNSSRIININNLLKEELEKYKRSCKYSMNERVFPICKSAINRSLKRYCKLAEVETITPHDFRHTHASILLNHGVDIASLSKRLGHSNVGVTLRHYAHMLPDEDVKTANLLDEI